MMKTNILLNEFAGYDYSLIEINEKITSLYLKINLSITKGELKKLVSDLNKILPERDSFQVNAQSEELSNSIGYNSQNFESINEFIDEWESSYNVFTFNLNKNVSDNFLSIYSPSEFIKYVSTNLVSALKDFSKLICKNSFISFEYRSETEVLEYIPASKEVLARDTLYSMNSEICNFNNSELIKLIPEDFTFYNSSETDELLKLFNKIQTVISIIYLYDTTSLNKSKFSATLCGQKKLKAEIDFDDILSNNSFYEIYNWVYRSGDIEEKIGLARNIISIHYIDNIFEIANNTFTSLKSNYKLYLKSNTKNYLEMKSQIEEHLWNTNRQMDSVKKEFSKNLFTTLIGILTFFITVILTGALTANKPVIFTKQVLLLSWIFISIFLLILVFKSIEEFFSIKKLKEEYQNMISRYKNLIDNQEFKTYEKIKNNFEFNLFSVNRILGFLLTVAIIICLLFSNDFSIKKDNPKKTKQTVNLQSDK